MTGASRAARIVALTAPGVLTALLTLGCAPEAATRGATSRPAVVFPTRAEIARLPSVAPKAAAFGADDMAVESWNFEAQAASDAAAYDDPSPWGDAARVIADAHGATVTLSPALRCAATEMARFHAKNGAMPAESLRRFMGARCGAVTTGLSPMFVSVTSPAPVPDSDLVPKAQEAFSSRLGERLGHGHNLLGVGVARDGQRTSAVALVSSDQLRLEPGSLGVDANRRVTLRGATRDSFTRVLGAINRGDAGMAFCDSDPTVAPPRFALTCELAPGDAFAWVEILGRKQTQLLLHEVAEAIVHEGDGSGLQYAARHAGPPAPVMGADDFTAALLDRLNGVRAAAHLAPLGLDRKQSHENMRLAGTLVDASFEGDDVKANLGAIGLLAGWEVQGLIRNGNFFMGAIGPARDATAWLDYAIERPLGRMTLLDPDARVVAVGPTFPPGGGAIGAAVTTYALFDSDDHTAEATRFFQRVAAARQARGLPAATRVAGIGEMEAELERVSHKGRDPMAALQSMMELAVERTGQGASGYVLETNDVDQADLPGALLAKGPLRLMVGVTHHRAEGAAWGQYVVVMVIVGVEGR